MKNAKPYIVLFAGVALILTGAATGNALIMAAPIVALFFTQALKA